MQDIKFLLSAFLIINFVLYIYIYVIRPFIKLLNILYFILKILSDPTITDPRCKSIKRFKIV